MFARVHKASETKGGNKGSSTDLATYLDKEKDNDLKFFSHSENDIPVHKVVNSIDNNRAQIGKNESKFFMLTLNPSDKEIKHLIGKDVQTLDDLSANERKELFLKMEDFTKKAMDKYAENFNRPTVKSGDDLMYFARIETERIYKKDDYYVKSGSKKIGDKKEGLNVHVHIMVSRKSKDGKVKLSPNAKSAGNEWDLKDRGEVKRGFSHDKWKLDVQEVFNAKFNFKPLESEQYKTKVIPKEDVLAKTTNADLKNILENNTITSPNQVGYLMKQQGYNYKFYRGNHIFKKENETFSIQNNEIKPFVQRVPDDKMKDILSRYSQFKFEKQGENYTDKDIKIEKCGFIDKRTQKEVNYYIVHDKESKTSISLSRLKNFAYDNHIKLFDRNNLSHLASIENEDLRTTISDKNFTTVGQVQAEMINKGYKCLDHGDHCTFLKDGNGYSMSTKNLNSFIYEKTPYEKHNKSVSSKAANKATNKVKSKAKNKVIQELTGGQFNPEIKAARTAVKAAKFVLNPKAAILQELKNMFRLENIKEM